MWQGLFGLVLVLLIGSNLYWFYLAADLASAVNYSEIDRRWSIAYGDYLSKLLPGLASGKDKDEIISIALKQADTDEKPFEKDGCTWIGVAGFQFDAQGTLSAVACSWQDLDYAGPRAVSAMPPQEG